VCGTLWLKTMTRATVKRLARDEMLKVFATLIKDQQERGFIEQVPTEQLTLKGVTLNSISFTRKTLY
jgi:hypothetical protein